eukprot:272362-Chlamydomonas_euryale.AAC.1
MPTLAHQRCAGHAPPKRQVQVRPPQLRHCSSTWRAILRRLRAHSTSCSWSTWGQVYDRLTNRMALETAQKKVFIRENNKNRVPASASNDEEISPNVL